MRISHYFSNKLKRGVQNFDSLTTLLRTTDKYVQNYCDMVSSWNNSNEDPAE